MVSKNKHNILGVSLLGKLFTKTFKWCASPNKPACV